MDVFGIGYSEFSDADREAIVAGYPRQSPGFKRTFRKLTKGFLAVPLRTTYDVAEVDASKL